MVRVGPRDDGSFAGIYQTAGEYNETSEYEADAPVLMVVVQR
jgi:hypothetical protein